MANRYNSYRSYGLRPAWSGSSSSTSNTTPSETPTSITETLGDLGLSEDNSGEGITDDSVHGAQNTTIGQDLSSMGKTAYGALGLGLSTMGVVGGNVLGLPGVIGGWSNFGNNYDPYAEPGWFGKSVDWLTGDDPTYGYGSYNQNPNTSDVGNNDVGWGNFGSGDSALSSDNGGSYGTGGASNPGNTGTSAVSSGGYQSDPYGGTPGEYVGGIDGDLGLGDLGSLEGTDWGFGGWDGVGWGDSGDNTSSDDSGPSSDYGGSSGSDDSW